MLQNLLAKNLSHVVNVTNLWEKKSAPIYAQRAYKGRTDATKKAVEVASRV